MWPLLPEWKESTEEDNVWDQTNDAIRYLLQQWIIKANQDLTHHQWSKRNV